MQRTSYLATMAVVFVSSAGCDVPPPSSKEEPPSSPGDTEVVQSELTGGVRIDSSCKPEFRPALLKASRAGRIASKSAVFAACIGNLRAGTPNVTSPYMPQCSPNDPHASESGASQASWVLLRARNPNTLTMTCGAGCGNNACAGIGNESTTSEAFEWNNDFVKLWATAPAPADDPWWPTTQAAGLIWHEVMHNYGYDHPTSCSTPGYNFQSNTVPYITQLCMSAVLTASGKTCGNVTCGPDQLPIVKAFGSGTCSCVSDPRTAKWFDATNAELTATGWPVGDVATSSWQQAARAGYGYCRDLSYEGGALNGWQSSTAKGTVCNGAGTKWFDISQAQRNASVWTFSDVNNVPWDQAARAAQDLCAVRGFVGGQFNGHQNSSTGGAGLVCYSTRSTFFNVARTDLTALGVPINDIRSVRWDYAARAADKWCTSRGFVGGRLNGNQNSTVLGAVCYK